MDEKVQLLTKKRDEVLDHARSVAARLTGQHRGELAEQLLCSIPFPADNRIVPAFAALSGILKDLNRACIATDARRILDAASVLMPVARRELDLAERVHLLGDVSRAVRRWASALSGEEQETEVYNAARLSVPRGESYEMYIVAYDLIGSSKGLYRGRAGAARDRYVQSVIANWFIAFGGYAQRAEFGGGDLGFGYFHELGTAIQASLWATYLLGLLKGTNPHLRQDGPHAGFGIVQDTLRSGFQDQVRSDWLSRFAKAWKREAEKIADKAGREGLPIIAVHSEIFSGAMSLPAGWVASSDELDGIPVRFIAEQARTRVPWQCSAVAVQK